LPRPYIFEFTACPSRGGFSSSIDRKKIGKEKMEIEETMIAGMLFGAPTALEMQELSWQNKLINSSTLPKGGDIEGWEALELAGVVKGKDLDDLLIEAILPKGWTKVGSEESLRRSYLLDARGLRRAGIFYKSDYDKWLC
jgi:hypothetical protein